MDLEARNRWVEFSKAKDVMFTHTNIPEAPWFTVEADDKRRARLNCIRHLLSKVPWEDMTPPAIKLPARPEEGEYERPPINEQFFWSICYLPLNGFNCEKNFINTNYKMNIVKKFFLIDVVLFEKIN